MSAREEAINRTLMAWAIRLDLPVTITDIASITVLVDRAIREAEPVRLANVPTVKPGATPDDARRIAARLEATWPRRQV